MTRDKGKDRSYGELVINFVNAQTTDEACFGLFENMQELFFSSDFAKYAKFAFTTNKLIAGHLSKAEKKEARLLLNETINEIKRRFSIILADFLIHRHPFLNQFMLLLIEYNDLCKVILAIGPDETFYYDIDNVSEKDFIKWPAIENPRYSLEIKKILSYCLIEFMKSPRNRELINRCEECKKYFIAKKVDQRNKFCPICSRKSKKSREDRRQYQREYRKKQKRRIEDEKRETKENEIKNYMKSFNISRKAALELWEEGNM